MLRKNHSIFGPTAGHSASICLVNLFLKSAAQAVSPDPAQPDASLPKMASYG